MILTVIAGLVAIVAVALVVGSRSACLSSSEPSAESVAARVGLL